MLRKLCKEKIALDTAIRGFTMLAMAEERKQQKKPKKVPFKAGAAKPVSMRLSQELVAALEDYLNSFAFRPAQSAVMELALRKYLEAEGYVFDPPVE